MNDAADRKRLVDHLRERGVIDRDSTARALRAVPRHEFVPEAARNRAYDDRPLPIGDGQTISAPHMVATMLDVLELEEGDEVLEIGTGCGYHAAVTAEVVGAGNVYSVEYTHVLAERARDTLDRLGYDIAVRTGDGHEGWPEHAPYDAAYLTCAAPKPPKPVLTQLREGSYFLGPIGKRRQELVRLTVGPDGNTRETFGGVRFVKMRR